jgi:hypothetical protein
MLYACVPCEHPASAIVVLALSSYAAIQGHPAKGHRQVEELYRAGNALPSGSRWHCSPPAVYMLVSPPPEEICLLHDAWAARLHISPTD